MGVRFIGEEMHVNLLEAGSQVGSNATALADGRYVVTWQGPSITDGTSDIYARMFNADGTPAGDDILVNASVGSTESDAKIAALDDGGFVVTWEGAGIHARVFNADGTARGGDIAINTTGVASDASQPSVAPLSDGGFTVLWRSRENNDYEIRGRRFDADGAAQGDDVLINTTTSNQQFDPTAALQSDGRLVTSWVSIGEEGLEVRARIFNSNGTAAGDDVLVDGGGENFSREPHITALQDGRSLVSWSTYDGIIEAYYIYGRLYAADGTPERLIIIDAPYGFHPRGEPAATVLADGRFVVTWRESPYEGGGSYDIRGRIFEADGTLAGSEFNVSPIGPGSEGSHSVVAMADGSFVVVWDAQGYEGGTSVEDIRAQRFQISMEPNAAPTEVVLTDTSIAEEADNGTVVGTFVVTDPDPDENFAFAIWDDAGGRFRVEGDKLVVANGALLRADIDPSHTVVVNVRDAAGNVYRQDLTITVEDEEDAGLVPVIVSDGRGDMATLRLPENSTAVTTVVAVGAGPGQTLSYSISGGQDADRFVIDAATGVLTFASAPDYEYPADANGDNVYQVKVSVTDGVDGSDEQTIEVDVYSVDGIFPPLQSDAPLIVGTLEEDVIIGLGRANTIMGLAGADNLSGGGGGDTLEGGDGDDGLIGGPGSDRINGGAGDDSILYYLGDGTDLIDGGAGNDRFSILGTAGDDTMTAVFDGTNLSKVLGNTLTSVESVRANMLDGADSLLYVNTTAGVAVDLAARTASGFVSIFGIHHVAGGAGADMLAGDSNANILNGGVGDDVFNGRLGDDQFIGGAGADTASYAGETDAIIIDLEAGTARRGTAGAAVEDRMVSVENAIGGAGDDIILGSGGMNVVDGGDGNDTLHGGRGNDILSGGDGDDVIAGDAGYDTLDGGAGDDLFRYGMGDGVDSVNGGDGFDTLTVTGTDGAGKLEVVFDGTSITGLTGGTVTGVEAVTADLLGGTDRLSYAGSMADVIVDLSLGQASGFASIAGVENVSGGAGDDTLIGDEQANTLAGGLGDDIYTAGFNDIIYELAGSGIDEVKTDFSFYQLAKNVENLTFTGSGNFLGIGNSEANVLTGGSGDDILTGWDGDDTLIGNAGNDTMRGMEGNDTFAFAANFGNDAVLAFDADAAGGQDHLDVAALGITNASFAARVLIETSGEDTLVTIDGGGTILLSGVTGAGANKITAEDFLLG